MQFLIDNIHLIITFAFLVTEALAAFTQLLFPNNKGVSGFIAGLIKILQSLGAKNG